MIHGIHNAILRRAALVFTVLSIVVVLGPLALISAVLGWIEREFEIDLIAIWRGKQTKRMK